MLACGCGMAQLAYHCALESKYISVINGKEKGSSVSKIKQAVSIDLLERLHPGFHVFLDNLSGDIYEYSKEKMQWVPSGNVGLHHSRAQASISGGVIGGMADQMKQAKTHKSNPNSSMKPLLIMTSDLDIKCDLRKNFLHHWILKGVYHEFIVENINIWDPHPINMTNLETV